MAVAKQPPPTHAADLLMGRPHKSPMCWCAHRYLSPQIRPGRGLKGSEEVVEWGRGYAEWAGEGGGEAIRPRRGVGSIAHIES